MIQAENIPFVKLNGRVALPRGHHVLGPGSALTTFICPRGRHLPFLTMTWRSPPRSDRPISGLGALAAECRPRRVVSCPNSHDGRNRDLQHLEREIGRSIDRITRGVAIHAFAASAEPERLTHAPVSEVTQTPVGWIELCARQPDECAGATMALRDFVLTPKRWNDLVRVNSEVNETIKPLTDLDHWGVVELWSYPDRQTPDHRTVFRV